MIMYSIYNILIYTIQLSHLNKVAINIQERTHIFLFYFIYNLNILNYSDNQNSSQCKT